MFTDTSSYQMLPQCQAMRETSKAENKTPVKNSILVLPLLLILVVMLGAGAIPRMKQEERLQSIHTGLLHETPEVMVVRARQDAKKKTLTLPGELLAIQKVPVYSRVNGYLLKRLVDIGDHVKAGQLLAVVDTPELDQSVKQASAALSSAQSNLSGAIADKANYAAQLAASDAAIKEKVCNLDYSEKQMERYSYLESQGAASSEQLDQMVREYKADESALETAKQNKLGHQAELTAANTHIEAAKHAVESSQAYLNELQATEHFHKILAPSDGVITDRYADPGALVVAGGASGTTPILEMDRSDVLRVHVEVPESDSVDIHQGDSVQINLQEYPNKIFTGSVTNVSGSLNPQSRTLPVEIIIDNHNQILKPGAYVEVHFKHAISTPPVIIPSNAAITKSDGTYVAIVNKNMIQYKRVKIHQDNGDTLAIDSGISPNDLVVADSGLTLPAGTVVKPETNTDW